MLARGGSASHPTLRRHLAALTVSGVVHEKPGESDGETPGRPATHFSLAPGVKNSVRSVLSVLA
jgi:predicted ArsR family transcriptional regulator